ncbi:uncharacterized protein [Haliotis cracherodii]|uniref:uncharacterized protein n=1 Tax=Haliotis cracherodii TaxID=6455 RepID=UPI0039EB08E8
MLSRILPVARSATASVSRLQAVRCMGGQAPAHWKSDLEVVTENRVTMNDHPIPEGSWQENYNKRNSKYNMYIAVSSLFLAVTGFILYQSGAVYLHSTPPLKKR